ncbi:MAG: hypothetical protein WAO95_12940 [Burkholderiales bacterium]
MLHSQLPLLFILYGAPSIAALLFLVLGFAMARSRFEVGFVGVLAGALVAVHAAELYFLWGLRQVLGGGSDDPLVVAGLALALLAGVLTWVFVARALKRLRRA